MFKRTILLLGIFVLAIMTVGCGTDNLVENKMERDLENQLGGNADVDINSGEINIQTTDGSFQAGENVQLPKDFPKDVYIIEGEIFSAMKNVAGQGTQVMISTEKSISETVEIYNEKLEAEDWIIQNTMNLGEVSMLVGVKGDRQVSVSVARDDDQTVVTLTVVTQ